jgi:predicted phage terminase large subunit-like protein
MREDVSRVSLFLTQQGGGMMSAGVGGPITGRGAHLLIIDDYIKNFSEAMSETVNESIWNWFTTVAYTRLEPGGSVIILATRWAKNDLIGRILEKEGHKWKRIRLPALAEQHDPLGRAPGDALWPQRYSAEKLHAIKELLGWMFNAMYQQDPVAQADMIVDPEGLKYLDGIENHRLLRWVRSWDLAATKQGGDYTVGTLIGTDGRPGNPFCKTIIADQKRKQLAPHRVEELMQETAKDDGHDVPIVIEQEPGSSGKIAAEHIAKNVLKGYKVTIAPSAGHSKPARNQPYLTAVSHGRIWLLKSAWNAHHKQELKDWPSGKHDDTIDSAAQGYNFLHQGLILTPTWGRDVADMITLPSGIVVPAMPLRPGTKRLVKGATWGRANA